MAGFVYFVETDEKGLSAERIGELGLAYAFDGPPSVREVGQPSPSGQRGLVFADSQRLGGELPGYYPADQTWRRMPDVDGRPPLYLGYWDHAKPTPADLERVPLVNGLRVQLADGHKWQVPEVRSYDAEHDDWECRLPSFLDYDAGGNVTRGRPLDQYVALWDATTGIASELFTAEIEERAPQVTDQEMVDCAVALLGANYAVSLAELVMLGALSDAGDTAFIVLAACRRDRLADWAEAVQKKS